MDKEKLIAGVVGGVVAGFSIGIGFMIAQRTMGKFFHKKEASASTDVADAVAKGVTDGVKQAKLEEDAANFASMTANADPRAAGRGGNRNNPRRAMEAQMMGGRRSSFMGFDGDPSKMEFNGDPLMFGGSPNANLNTFS